MPHVPKKPRLGILIALMLLVVSFPVFARADDTQDTNADPVVTTPASTSPATTDTTDNPAPAQNLNQAPSEPTTTPAVQRENQSTKDTPPADPTYNQNIENILNQSIPPIPNPPKNKNKEKKQKATSTPIISNEPVSLATSTDDQTIPTPKKSTSTSTTNTSTSTNPTTAATSTPASTFTRTTDGGSNFTVPGNYYFPLDSLSTQETFSLSGLAIMLGIIGAILIIRDPRQKEEMLWVPNLQQSLLEN